MYCKTLDCETLLILEDISLEHDYLKCTGANTFLKVKGHKIEQQRSVKHGTVETIKFSLSLISLFQSASFVVCT